MDENSAVIIDDTKSSRHIIFSLLVIVEIASILSTLLILIYTAFHWHSMVVKSLHHHAILLLMIISFFYITLDLPFIIVSTYYGFDPMGTSLFCQWWYWIDYTLLSTSLILAAIASLQRHLLVFNSNCLRISYKRWLFHYIPLIFCILYPSLFYIDFIYIYPCDIWFDESNFYCSYPCYSNIILYYNIDWMLNYIVPMFIIVLANLILIGRVIYSKHRIGQQFSQTWKKQRKLTLQLLLISSVYVIGWIPALFVSTLQTYFLPDLFDINPQLYFINRSSLFVCPLQSLTCLFAIPELMNFIQNRMKFRRQRRIHVTETPFSMNPRPS